jgi:hypothetical protein
MTSCCSKVCPSKATTSSRCCYSSQNLCNAYYSNNCGYIENGIDKFSTCPDMIGPIVGGVIGGISFILLIILIVYLVRRQYLKGLSIT